MYTDLAGQVYQTYIDEYHPSGQGIQVWNSKIVLKHTYRISVAHNLHHRWIRWRSLVQIHKLNTIWWNCLCRYIGSKCCCSLRGFVWHEELKNTLTGIRMGTLVPRNATLLDRCMVSVAAWATMFVWIVVSGAAVSPIVVIKTVSLWYLGELSGFLLSIGNVGPIYVCCPVCHYLKIWSDCVLLALCNFTILPVLYGISTPAAPICHDAMHCIAICKYGIKVM